MDTSAHPLRLQYEMFSRANPFMQTLLSSVKSARENRQPVSKDNVFWQAQEWFAEWMETSLNTYRDVRDHMSEAVFHGIYGSELLQAAIGLRAADGPARCRPGKDAAHVALISRRIAERS